MTPASAFFFVFTATFLLMAMAGMDVIIRFFYIMFWLCFHIRI